MSFGFTHAAYAGSYLDRCALLLLEARRSNDVVLTHLTDKELATMVHEIAEVRVKSGRAMTVPKEVAGVHPHLLLVLENSERAAAAVLEGSTERFLHHLRLAREEESTLRALLAEQKLELPSWGEGKRQESK